MWRETREKVELEMGQLQHLVDSHRRLLDKAASVEPDAIEISALSAYLHSFYTGLENIFKQIAVDIDSERPAADRWHSELLQLMAVSTASRPEFMSQSLVNKLVGYMGFRHVFRHAYTFDLKWSKMEMLVKESEAVLNEIRVACDRLFGDEDRMLRNIEVEIERISEFCQKWKVAELSLFGSVLREDFREDSDVDVLVTFRPDAHLGLIAFCKMELELSGIIGRKVDLVTKTGLKPLVRDAVLSHVETLYAA